MKSNNNSKIKMLLKILAILHKNFFLYFIWYMYLCTFQCWWNNYQELKGDNNENLLKHVQETKIV